MVTVPSMACPLSTTDRNEVAPPSLKASSRDDGARDGQDRDLLNGGDMSEHKLRVLRTEIQEVAATLYIIADAARTRGDADVRATLLLLARHVEAIEADLDGGEAG